jgi:nitrite reductase/ring-hydroxylating ferredoxin subunit
MNLPLSNRSKGIFDRDQRHLVCIQHAAAFDIENGHCVKGPCLGMKLEPVNIETNNGKLFLKE